MKQCHECWMFQQEYPEDQHGECIRFNRQDSLSDDRECSYAVISKTAAFNLICHINEYEYKQALKLIDFGILDSLARYLFGLGDKATAYTIKRKSGPWPLPIRLYVRNFLTVNCTAEEWQSFGVTKQELEHAFQNNLCL